MPPSESTGGPEAGLPPTGPKQHWRNPALSMVLDHVLEALAARGGANDPDFQSRWMALLKGREDELREGLEKANLKVRRTLDGQAASKTTWGILLLDQGKTLGKTVN